MLHIHFGASLKESYLNQGQAIIGLGPRIVVVEMAHDQTLRAVDDDLGC